MIQKIEINFLSFFLGEKTNNLINNSIFLVLSNNEYENLANVMCREKLKYFETFKGIYKIGSKYDINIYEFKIIELVDAKIPKEWDNYIRVLEGKNILEIEVKK